MNQLVEMLKKCDEVTEKDRIRVLAKNVYYKHCNVYTDLSNGSIFRGRDNMIISGSGSLVKQNVYGTPLFMTINVRNEFSTGTSGLLSVDVRGMVIAHGAAVMSMNVVVSDELYINFAHSNYETSEGIVTNPPYSNYRMGNGLNDDNNEFSPAHSASGGVFANLKEEIPNGTSKTFYVQYFLIFHSSGGAVVDVRASVDAVLFPIKLF